MTKELQDLAWKGLPAEFRKEVTELYHTALNESIFNAYEDVKVYEYLFGKHNLNKTPKYQIGDRINWLSKERVISAIHLDNPIMYEFEGCVGMLAEDQIDSCNGCKAELEQRLEQAVQLDAACQFKVGDDVWCGSLKCNIYNIKGRRAYVVHRHGADWVAIHRLRPYVEPQYKFNLGDKVIFRNKKVKVIKKRYPSPYDDLAHYLVETLNGQSPINVDESELEPYTEEI